RVRRRAGIGRLAERPDEAAAGDRDAAGAVRERRLRAPPRRPRRQERRGARLRAGRPVQHRDRARLRRRPRPRLRHAPLPPRPRAADGRARRPRRLPRGRRRGGVRRGERGRARRRRLRDVRRAGGDRGLLPDRAQRRPRHPLRDPRAPGRDRRRGGAHLQESRRLRRERAPGLGHVVPDALAARARRRRPPPAHHRGGRAGRLRARLRAARERRRLQDRDPSEHGSSGGGGMKALDEDIRTELDALQEAGTYKQFNVLESPQGPVVQMAGRGDVIVLSSNNYLGLADHPDVIEAGIDGLYRYGAGTASVRFICGTFAPHLELERELAELSETEAALPTRADEKTVIVSDELNHASIIDAVRLSKPQRKLVFKHSDMGELREALRSCEKAQRKLILTDGVFSMEGDLAKLPDILELARAHDAVVLVDDSHGVGVVGATGRGVAEHYGVLGQVDVMTGTLGKALGGAAGGYVASTEEVCDLL